MTADRAAPGRRRRATAPVARTPKGMHDVLWPESARWEAHGGPFRRPGRGRRLRADHHADPRARRRLPPRHRRGERGRRQGDVRLRGPRRPDDGAAARGHGPHRPRLRAAPPGAALEGLVRGAVVPPREPPARAATASTTSWASRRSAPPTRTSTSRSCRWPTTSSPGSGCAQVTLKLHSMGDGVCKPGLRGAARGVPGRAGRSALPGPPRPAPGEPAAGPRLQDARSAGPPRPTPRTSSTTCATPARRTSPGCAPGSTRSAWPTRSTTAWCAASTTTPARRSSSPRTPSTRRRTASAAAAATTAWSSCSAGTRRPGIGFGIGVERVLLACDAEGVFSTAAALAARPLHAYVIDTAGGETAARADGRAAPGRPAGRPGLRRALHEVADQVGRPLGGPGGPGGRAPGAGRGHGRPAPAAQRRRAADGAPGCHRGRAARASSSPTAGVRPKPAPTPRRRPSPAPA